MQPQAIKNSLKTAAALLLWHAVFMCWHVLAALEESREVESEFP
jgi:hypothetical protein